MVDCYADAYFVGLWGHENTQDPICARNINGFVVTFDDCPLLWVSKIQTENSLSTLHSQYVALYHSVRALLPLKSLINEVIEKLGIDSKKLKFVSSPTIYENNNGAIVLATSPRITPTSKHISVNYHWSRQYIGKELVIWKTGSENQKADIFTKGLQGEFLSVLRSYYAVATPSDEK